MAKKPAILADTFYGVRLGENVTTLESAILQHFGRIGQRLARRSSLARGAMAVWIGRKYDLLVTCQSWPGGKWVVILSALFSNRANVMLLEFIVNPRRGIGAVAHKVWFGWVLLPALRRSLRAAQVMTAWEIPTYVANLKIPESRFRHIAWPLLDDTIPPPSPVQSNRKVLSSGRAACDWETLFRAARGSDWELFVVCGKADMSRVNQLNFDNRAAVLCDISPEEHQAHLRSSCVYVLALEERTMSSGQVRLMGAISAGVPVVATRVRGLEGYAIDEKTAILVEPGDHVGLRQQVDRLLANPTDRQVLRDTALSIAKDRTASIYYQSILDVILEIAAESPCAI